MKPRSKPTKVRRRYPLHAVFLIYCLVSLLVAVGAFNANNNLLFWLFGLSLGMLLVSGLISGTMMMAISVRRLPIEQPRVGEPLRVRYAITNRSRFLPVIGLVINERVGAGDDQTNVRQAALHAPPTGSVPHVPARTTIVVETLALPTQRGRLSLAGYDVLTTFPFGIIRKSLAHDDPVSVIVQPAKATIPGGLFEHAKGNVGSGAAATRPGRLGDEPVGVREYRPGDASKLVSWRASARRPNGDLLVRQNAEGSPRRAWVMLRLSAGTPAAQTEAAISVAATLVRAAASCGLHVGLSLRTDWTGQDKRPFAFDLPPRSNQSSSIILNDLALLVVPARAESTAMVAGEPRLSAADIVVRVTHDGTVQSQPLSAGRRGSRKSTVGGAA